MEPTLTQNGALDLAQHRIAKERRTFFKVFRDRAKRQGPDVRGPVPFGEAAIVLRFNPDNGR
jgi:hypothetical protein